jgi:hypothetical protein
VNTISGEIGSDLSKHIPDDISPPEFLLPEPSLYADGMKCWNLLGILWAGRDHQKRFTSLIHE